MDIDVQVDLEIACGTVNVVRLEQALLNAEFREHPTGVAAATPPPREHPTGVGARTTRPGLPGRPREHPTAGDEHPTGELPDRG
jgi:hypothetical protein